MDGRPVLCCSALEEGRSKEAQCLQSAAEAHRAKTHGSVFPRAPRVFATAFPSPCISLPSRVCPLPADYYGRPLWPNAVPTQSLPGQGSESLRYRYDQSVSPPSRPSAVHLFFLPRRLETCCHSTGIITSCATRVTARWEQRYLNPVLHVVTPGARSWGLWGQCEGLLWPIMRERGTNLLERRRRWVVDKQVGGALHASAERALPVRCLVACAGIMAQESRM